MFSGFKIYDVYKAQAHKTAGLVQGTRSRRSFVSTLIFSSASLPQLKMPVFIIFVTIAVFICIAALPFICNNAGWCYALVMRCCCKVNTNMSYSVNQVDRRVQPQPLGLMGLKPEERQKIFERILVGKVCERGWQ